MGKGYHVNYLSWMTSEASTYSNPSLMNVSDQSECYNPDILGAKNQPRFGALTIEVEGIR